MDERIFREKCRKAVVFYHNSHTVFTDEVRPLGAEDVYIVWQCKILQNNKALLSTPTDDGLYYEYTWNGDKNEGYLDVYKKQENIVVY
jgi:hypothetical protein